MLVDSAIILDGHSLDPTTDKDRTLGVLRTKVSSRGINIDDIDLISRLDRYSIEDVVELKVSRFLDQIGTFYPENVHELIMSKLERPLLVQILRRVGGNQVQAAKILGINRNTLRKKIKHYGL